MTECDKCGASYDSSKSMFCPACVPIDEKEPAKDIAICKGCHAEILWAKTNSGKSHPFNKKPTLALLGDGTVCQVHITHYATCPKAKEF